MRVSLLGGLAAALLTVSTLHAGGRSPFVPPGLGFKAKVVIALPDYIISKMVPVGSTLRVAVTNVGKGNGTKVSVVLINVYNGNALVATMKLPCPPVPAGQTRWVSGEPLPLHHGFVVKARADFTNVIFESNEGNNGKSIVVP